MIPNSRRVFPLIVLPLLLIGCKSAPPPQAAATEPAEPVPTYPARPSVAPALFKIFHHGNNSFTLTVPESSTDDQIAALVWELRDAAHNKDFDRLHIPQKQVDSDGPNVWFHIYRGTKCAPEKYVPEPPCGHSYHAAGDYSLDTHKSPPWDSGVLVHDERSTPLWNSEAPYTPPAQP